MSPAPRPFRAANAAVVESALVVVGFLVVFFVLPHALYGDDVTRFADVKRLLDRGELSDSKYSLVMPLASVPVLELGHLVNSESWWASRFNVLVVAAAAAAAFLLLRRRADHSALRQILLVLLFASYLTNRLRDYNSELFTAALVTVGLVALDARRRALGWGCIVVGVVNTPAAGAGLAVVALLEAWRKRRLGCLLPIAIAAGRVMAEAWIRRGGPLTTGYEHDQGFRTVIPHSGESGFSSPFRFGVVSILFSFGRGLVFFMPGLLFVTSRGARGTIRRHRTLLLLLAFVAGLVLVYAKWWAWYGGAAWGPRFFTLAAVPASALVVARLRRAGESIGADTLTLGVLVLSGWVGVAGAVSSPLTPLACSLNNWAREDLCWYSPEFSPLGAPLAQFPSLTLHSAAMAGCCAGVFAYLAAPVVAALWRAARAGPLRASPPHVQ